MELELVGKLVEYGILGIVLIAVAWLARYLLLDLKKSWETRILDNKQLVQVIEATNRTYEILSESISDRAKAVDALATAQMSTAKAMEVQIDSMRALEKNQELAVKQVNTVIQQAAALREDIERLHKRMLEESARLSNQAATISSKDERQ